MNSGILVVDFARLAMDFGVALGFLRAWSGGLALPIIAHVASDYFGLRKLHTGTHWNVSKGKTL